ncbi:hypothetical protein E3V33_04170 [Candidatus Marinimicrobia bacterium MT.SAG.4]|nr:hypothetical protein E3V33_04170 [Candidatus Marinimicrobia bacterium MT.SAG.4]
MIILTGMHRSGTSLSANLLYEMGENFGDESMLRQADKWNEKGYFENNEVLTLNNDIILGGLGNSQYWLIPSHDRNLFMNISMRFAQLRYLSFPSKKTILKRAERYKSKLIELAIKYDSIIANDARFSLTIGAWANYGRIDKILYCIRDPLEVAKSLKRRQQIPYWLGYKMWHYHVNRFFDQVDGLRIVVVNYNNLFQEEKASAEMMRFYRFAGREYKQAESLDILQRVLDKKLRHHVSASEDYPDYIKKMYRIVNNYHNVYDTLKPFQVLRT